MSNFSKMKSLNSRYLLVQNEHGKNRKTCEVCSRLTIKTLELLPVSLFLTLNLII